jgi:hypothetical protein
MMDRTFNYKGCKVKFSRRGIIGPSPIIYSYCVINHLGIGLYYCHKKEDAKNFINNLER